MDHFNLCSLDRQDDATFIKYGINKAQETGSLKKVQFQYRELPCDCRMKQHKTFSNPTDQIGVWKCRAEKMSP